MAFVCSIGHVFGAVPVPRVQVRQSLTHLSFINAPTSQVVIRMAVHDVYISIAVHKAGSCNLKDLLFRLMPNKVHEGIFVPYANFRIYLLLQKVVCSSLHF